MSKRTGPRTARAAKHRSRRHARRCALFVSSRRCCQRAAVAQHPTFMNPRFFCRYHGWRFAKVPKVIYYMDGA
jgi:hypothetical protein